MTKQELLDKLKEQIRNGNLTPTDRVEFGTFLCLTQATPFGMAYHQGIFEQFPIDLAKQLHGKMKGDLIGSVKIVAIFDTWPEAKKERLPVQVFNN